MPWPVSAWALRLCARLIVLLLLAHWGFVVIALFGWTVFVWDINQFLWGEGEGPVWCRQEWIVDTFDVYFTVEV